MNRKIEYKIEDNKSWFDMLPKPVQHKVFLLLDYSSLITFSETYSQYIEDIVKPVYWIGFRFFFHYSVLDFQGIESFVSNIGKYTKYFGTTLSGHKEDDQTISFIKNILDYFHHVESFNLRCKCYTLFESIVINISKSIKFLLINADDLQDEHLVRIADCCKNIVDLIVGSGHEKTYGLEYLLEQLSNIRSFGFHLPRTSHR